MYFKIESCSLKIYFGFAEKKETEIFSLRHDDICDVRIRAVKNAFPQSAGPGEIMGIQSG